MATEKTRNSEDLTLVVFKDQLPSRSFRLPLNWISRLGLLINLSVLIATASGLLALKYFREARRANPGRILELERQIEELKVTLREGATQPATSTSPTSPSAPLSSLPSDPHDGDGLPGTSAQATPVAAPTMPASLNRFFPDPIKPWPADRPRPVAISSLAAKWQGAELKITFNIQYTANDGGTQQGRIFVFARGPSTLLSYPENLFSSGKEGQWISVEAGEYFSVGRFRATQANFPTVQDRSKIKRVDIILVSTDGYFLINQEAELSSISSAVTVGPKPVKALTTPTPTAVPEVKTP